MRKLDLEHVVQTVEFDKEKNEAKLPPRKHNNAGMFTLRPITCNLVVGEVIVGMWEGWRHFKGGEESTWQTEQQRTSQPLQDETIIPRKDTIITISQFSINVT